MELELAVNVFLCSNSFFLFGFLHIDSAHQPSLLSYFIHASSHGFERILVKRDYLSIAGFKFNT